MQTLYMYEINYPNSLKMNAVKKKKFNIFSYLSYK